VSLSRLLEGIPYPVISLRWIRRNYRYRSVPKTCLASASADKSTLPFVRVSHLLRNQLYIIAVAGIEKAERALLQTLDRQMKRCERQDCYSTRLVSVILGLFLRRLSLVWKYHAQRLREHQGRFLRDFLYSTFILTERDSRYAPRVKGAEHMYGGFFAAYTTLVLSTVLDRMASRRFNRSGGTRRCRG